MWGLGNSFNRPLPTGWNSGGVYKMFTLQ